MVAVVAVSFAVAWMISANREQIRAAKVLAEREAAWAQEKAELKADLPHSKQSVPLVEQRTQIIEKVKTTTPQEIIERLKAGKLGSTPNRSIRFAVQQLENLIDFGPTALPAIQEFLALNEDVNYDFSNGGKKKGSIDSIVPSSLRFGLFDVVKEIGGEKAEELFAEVLRTTGRGIEVSYLAKTLQELAPDKYRELALSVAHDLLAHPTSTDKNDRDYLYGILALYNDNSLVSQAQAQMIQADGQIDRSALKYLQKSMGEQVVALVADAYKDSRIDPAKKEPLARVAMFYAGANQQATELYTAAIMDERLSVDARRTLLEDWGGEGFSNPKSPTPADQKLLEARLKLAADYATLFTNPKLITSLGEAQKDFQHMKAKLAANAPHP